VTYAGEMPENTELVRGDWWGADYSGPPVISFAREEAEEMGLQIGDELTVNILGRDITARIMNFQEVSFENVGIGFILTMNAGALAGAPHSWISTVYTDQASEAQILRDLAQQYPNITAIRVRDGIDRVVEILSGIATATRYGAAATLLTGFLVLIGAAAAGSRARAFESGVLKTLGASRRRIMISFALRSVLLGRAAGIVAIGAGWLGGWAVIRFIMDSDFAFDFGSSATIIACGVAAVLLSNLVFARRALSARPARVLRGRE
jgi:putative ABC transport system permease protein